MKEQTTTTVQVRGRGETKQKAFAAALNGVQKAVLNQNANNILLRIQPLDVAVVKAIKTVRREKFFFFFFPRDRVTYDITLDVEIDVTTIDVETIEFE
jgi:uncharacterized protein (TIGR03578 family)